MRLTYGQRSGVQSRGPERRGVSPLSFCHLARRGLPRRCKVRRYLAPIWYYLHILHIRGYLADSQELRTDERQRLQWTQSKPRLSEKGTDISPRPLEAAGPRKRSFTAT